MFTIPSEPYFSLNMSAAQPAIDYDTLLAHIQTLEIPILDFVNHLQCTFHIEDVIGDGGAMTVYKALYRRNPQHDPIEVALKIPKQPVKENSRDKVISQMLAAVRQEIRMMKSLRESRYIVSLYGIAFRDLKPILVMELAISNLNDYIISKKDDGDRVTWEAKARFCYEIAEGIMLLHSIDIVHGDIKADNILLFADPTEENELIAKISDFGYSSTMASIARGGGTGGTPSFLAPECTPKATDEMKLYENKPTKDNYSYGLLVWQVAVDGEKPYEDMDVNEIDEAKHTDRQLLQLMDLLPEDTPESFKQLIIRMTQYMPNEREDLVNVRTIIFDIGNIDLSKNIRYAEAKETFEIGTRKLSKEIGGVKLKSLRSMPIPPSIKKRLFRTYETAATRGDAEAAYFLSVCYGSEFGVKLDKAKMISWAIEAAKRGNFEGVKNIASSYSLSIAQLPDNRTLLFPWILKIAESGHRKSQIFISECYKNGVCVEEDVTKYWEWDEKWRNNYDPTQYEESDLPEESALDCAAREGNIEAIKFFLLQENIDVNAKNSSGFTPLLLAATYNHTEVIKMLVTKFGADVNIRAIKGYTPLHLAAATGALETLELLVVSFDVDVNAQNDEGWTPFHLAAQSGYTDTAKLLAVNLEADTNIANNNNVTPLHSAAQNGNADIVELLVIRFGADVNVTDDVGVTPLHSATLDGYFDIMKLLLAAGADVNSKDNDGWAPLYIAAEKGRNDIVKLLVAEFGADVNARDNEGWTPLHQASRRGHVDTVKLLVEFGADLSAKSNYQWLPLHSAAHNGHLEIVKLFVQLGADTNAKISDGRISLHLVASGGHIDLARFFVADLKADVNAKDNNGWTPLHIAAEKGHIDIVKLLVAEFGADVNARDNEGWTPLHQSSHGGHVDTMKLLAAEFGADANARSNERWTPFHLAAENGHIEIVRLFVAKFGTDVGNKTDNGRTPLHLAAGNGHIDTVKLLVADFGADVNAKDKFGWTPLHSAASNGLVDTVKLLVGELEADINSRDEDGRIPLIFSSGEKCDEVALALLEHPHADINVKTEDGQTLLHLAVKYRKEIVVKILIEQFHLDIYAKDSRGQTPLDLVDNPPIHEYRCDGCGKDPIIGERYKCTVCTDFDFCSTCHPTVDHFNGEHIFKIVELPSVKHLFTD